MIKGLAVIFFATQALGYNSAAEPLKCRKFKCFNKESSTCVQVDKKNVTHYECPTEQYCPGHKILPSENINCTKTPEDPVPELICPPYVKEGQTCNPKDDQMHCDPEFYCKASAPEIGVCTKRLKLGSKCSNLYSCEKGTICNKGQCVKHFSVKKGDPSDSKVACETGMLKDGVCSEGAYTVGSIPKKCQKHSDCEASNSQLGECVCIPNKEGDSYCKLHQSDSIWVEYLSAEYDGIIPLRDYRLNRAIHYPKFELVEECFKDSLEYRELKMLEEYAEKCFSVLVGVSASLLTISLI